MDAYLHFPVVYHSQHKVRKIVVKVALATKSFQKLIVAKALFVKLHLFKSRSFLIFAADIFRKYDKFKDKTRYSTKFIA